MKRFLKFLVVIGLMFLTSSGFAGTGKFDGNITSATISMPQNFDLYVPDADRLSVQAAYYTVTVASIGFTDGTRSTGTITVTANTGLTGSTLTINSQNFVQGIDWQTGTLSSNTALNIYNVISSTYSGFATGTLIVNSTYSITGTSFAVYGLTFVAGTDFSVGKTTITTATNILNVLVSSFTGIPLQISQKTGTLTLTYCSPSYAGNSTMTSYSSSYTVTGMSGGRQIPVPGINFSLANASTVIYATSSVVGIVGNYKITSSTQSQLTVVSMGGGINSDMIYGGQARINKTNSYPLGLALLYTVQVGTSPTSLTPNTTYYAVPGDGTYFQLATSTQNAANKAVIGFTKANYDNASTLVLTALSITTAGYGFLWQASDDGDNWSNLASSFSYTAAGNSLWDFSNYNYKYLRAAFTSSYTGAIKLILRYWGKF